MRIHTESADGSSFTVKFPNWILLNRLGIGFALKGIARRSKTYAGRGKTDEYTNNKTDIGEKKAEERLAAKRLKRALVPVLADLKSFLKRHPNFVLVEGVDSDGDSFIITL